LLGGGELDGEAGKGRVFELFGSGVDAVEDSVYLLFSLEAQFVHGEWLGDGLRESLGQKLLPDCPVVRSPRLTRAAEQRSTEGFHIHMSV
jgi:hypothetical protein